MAKAESNKQKKKEALYNTAFELFTTKGIHKTTISDIVQKAGVAKGTFYLYFADKYDISNKLVAKKTSSLFTNAVNAVTKTDIEHFQDRFIFIIDHIIDELTRNKALLTFISKNLGWGVFKSALENRIVTEDLKFYDMYLNLLEEDEYEYEEPEIMLFTIIELVGSSAYSCILSNEPVSIVEYKPYLYRTIRIILESHKLTL
ncbi:MAG: TetR/AcrR family transcriptional regulator [Lachnospiraceae bacterium]|nr:TetR/AcrR family transcriptional regulator [Lachnospiraceae bacterium]